MNKPLPRAEVLRRGRIAVLDDEIPEMLKDLSDHGLAVTHLTSTEDPQFHSLGEGRYDLLLLDYGGIGARFGHDEGLDVLRYLKRVNPSLRILAFTARTFDASKADFFRLSEGIIKKDAGIRETLEQIELNLSEVLTPAYQFQALTAAMGVRNGGSDEMDRVLSKAVAGRETRDKALQVAKSLAVVGGEKILEAMVTKAIELGVTYIASAA